ncbi:MAG: GNAT family N-acetyltransferase [Actinobacteria bacterium]|nr:GNAT family N-acetyltransferase [Actinomycetota bacterium]
MKPDPFDPTTAPEVHMRARYAFDCQMEAELDPDTPVYPYDAWLKFIRQTSPFQDNHRWVAWDEDRRDIVGAGFIGLGRTDENRHLANFDIHVLPARRREGLGTALLREIVDVAEADERTVLGSGTVQHHEAEKFLAAMTMTQKMLDRRSRCYINKVPQELLDDWIANGEAKASAAGYSLLFFPSPIPDGYREGFLDVLRTMNDAPRDDLDMEDWVMTEERLADRERRQAASGDLEWLMVVRHDETGEFVSFTGLEWHPSVPQLLWQGGTAVKPAHRGHAIGRWIKASMMQKVRTEQSEAEFIDTWNAGSNKWMLAINDDLGFSPYLWYTDWQAPLADIKAAAAAK